jgi:putative ABC transport system permease protein
MKFFMLILKSLRRNLLRTILTALGTMVLVFVLSLIWSVLSFLADLTSEKNQNFKLIITERWQIPSQMPYRYADILAHGAAEKPEDVVPVDSMTWQFFLGSIESDSSKRSNENIFFAFGMDPRKLTTMMDDLDQLSGADLALMDKLIAEMEADPRAVVIGPGRLKRFKKSVGDSMTVYGINYKDLKFDVRIVGTFPASLARYEESGVMNGSYIRRALEQYEVENKHPHKLADRCLNLMWLKVKTRAEFEQIAQQLEQSPSLRSPQVKCETQAAGIANFLDAYKDLFWGVRFLLGPAIIVTLSLVISNAISISVRERRTEFAILKVLGFRPWHILVMVLGEALLIGVGAGVLSAAGTYVLVNYVMGGIKFPIGFIPAFNVPLAALWWGLAVGVGTAVAGSILPAINAQRTNVAQVFAKVA